MANTNTAATVYQQMITEDLMMWRRRDISPRFIEAWMRCNFGTLSGLSRRRFSLEVLQACRSCDAFKAEQNEELAQSYGL